MEARRRQADGRGGRFEIEDVAHGIKFRF
jgi:hypothetical protein